MTYPLSVETFSDIANATYSVMTHEEYYCDEIIYVTIHAKDRFNNTLSDYGVKISAKIEYKELGENVNRNWFLRKYTENYPRGTRLIIWNKEETFKKLDHSLYRVHMSTIERGFYDLTSYICEIQENDCANKTLHTQLVNTPVSIKINTKYPHPDFSRALGTGTIFAKIGFKKTFFIQLRDKFNNKFDVSTDLLHIGNNHRGRPFNSEDFFMVKMYMTDDIESKDLSK